MDLALLRIEYKLDLLLHSALGRDGVLRDLLADARGDRDLVYGAENLCPVCEEIVRVGVQVSADGEGYSRDCGCHPPVSVVQGVSQLLRSPEKAPSKSAMINPPPEDASTGDATDVGPSTTSSTPPK